jgi:polysaccharide export outer membrane protein
MTSTIRTAPLLQVSACVTALLLGGCATLPASGPTAHDLIKAQRRDNHTGFQIVTIDPSIVSFVAKEDADMAARPLAFGGLREIDTNDLLGPGDILQISVFEVGVSLFGDGGDQPNAAARGQALPPITVDRAGSITIPYAGRLHVAGKTPADVEQMIARGLRGISQSPQALVTVRENVANTVYVFGEVRKPGRYPLSLRHETLTDAIGLAGGSAFSAEDTLIRFTRGSSVLEERLGRVRAGLPGDVALLPGDRIELIKRPRTFLILGASTKVNQVPFETGDVSLAEAVARAGGPADATADPSAVFLFRYDPRGVEGPATPIVYRLNMMKPDSYFLAQRFMMRDKDVVYIGNAAANQPSKLVAIINQLFSPFVTARAISR